MSENTESVVVETPVEESVPEKTEPQAPQSLWEELAENRQTIETMRTEIATIRPNLDHLELHTQIRSNLDTFVMDTKRYEHENREMSFADSVKFSSDFYTLRDVGQAYIDTKGDTEKLNEVSKCIVVTPTE